MSTNKFHSSVGEVKPDNRNFLDKISDNLNNYLVDRNKANVNREEFSNNGSSTVDNSNNADVKVPRELSRSHHLLWLGQAYLLTKNEKYVNEFIFQIENWIDENPIMKSINWGCAMDV